MILLSYGFTFVVGLAVIILLAVAASAIWQSLPRRQGIEADRKTTAKREK
jgi:hypothetical protein